MKYSQCAKCRLTLPMNALEMGTGIKNGKPVRFYVCSSCKKTILKDQQNNRR